MILSFTKDIAAIFALDLKAAKSEIFTVTPILDDWVMACLWNRDTHMGITLMHKHSLFSIVVVSEVKDLFYCLDLFYEQLFDLLTEIKLNEQKYLDFLSQLFNNINALKNDDKTISSQIKFIYDKLEQYENAARLDGTKLHSIEISRKINNTPRKKLNSLTPNEVFTDLLKQHYNDPMLEIRSYEEHPVTIH
jgi:hypothetical protein